MQRRFVALLHIGYWMLYLLLLALVFAIICTQSGRTASLLTILFASRIGFVLIVPNVLAFYLSYLLLFPHFLARKRFLPMVIGSVVGSIGSAAVCLPVFFGAFHVAKPVILSTKEIVGLVACLMGVALIHMTIALVMHGFIRWYGDIAVNEELRRKTSTVEAALLRSKLDPHFLFNTLNNIDVLITRDAASASLYLNQLCEILRFVLYEARADRIPLEAELEYVDKYIALQRIRMASPHYVTWEVAGDPTGLMLAPMLLIPFIENAFKHAEGQRRDNAINISVAVDGKRILFQCSNRYRQRGNSAMASIGLGNDLTQRRLALLYPGRYTLDVSNQDDTYTVLLRIDLDEPALHHC